MVFIEFTDLAQLAASQRPGGIDVRNAHRAADRPHARMASFVADSTPLRTREEKVRFGRSIASAAGEILQVGEAHGHGRRQVVPDLVLREQGESQNPHVAVFDGLVSHLAEGWHADPAILASVICDFDSTEARDFHVRWLDLLLETQHDVGGRGDFQHLHLRSAAAHVEVEVRETLVVDAPVLGQPRAAIPQQGHQDRRLGVGCEAPGVKAIHLRGRLAGRLCRLH
mmetsp:Transcript_92061/g.260094  ORF Transcript_92061/g.260094 Transcript_92061/m.260094 type:complete len:226 (-) Transcript_92061:1152-1829(-)